MGKQKSYQPWTQDQIFLMPPSTKEWLKDDHQASSRPPRRTSNASKP